MIPATLTCTKPRASHSVQNILVSAFETRIKWFKKYITEGWCLDGSGGGGWIEKGRKYCERVHCPRTCVMVVGEYRQDGLAFTAGNEKLGLDVATLARSTLTVQLTYRPLE